MWYQKVSCREEQQPWSLVNHAKQVSSSRSYLHDLRALMTSKAFMRSLRFGSRSRGRMSYLQVATSKIPFAMRRQPSALGRPTSHGASDDSPAKWRPAEAMDNRAMAVGKGKRYWSHPVHWSLALSLKNQRSSKLYCFSTGIW